MRYRRARCRVLTRILIPCAWFAISPPASTGALLEARGQQQTETNQTARPPDVPDHFLFRPHIETTSGMMTGGTVFAARLPGEERPILMTALHVFGPAGGMKTQLAARDLPAAVKKVTLEGLFDRSEVIHAGERALSIPDAAPFPSPSKAGDIVAIRPNMGAKLTSRPLAAEMPRSGERVWLAASVVGGAPASRRLHEATVKELDANGLLIYVFENSELELRATSGAPILNAAGEIVGIQAAAGKLERDLFGVATLVTKFRPSLETALKANPAR